jgi:hypothetical protein
MITPHAACLVRRWVALYTHGLPAEPRDRRREEVAGDLWSQAEDSRELGRGDGATATDMVIRLIAGIPADVSWRLEHRSRPAPSAIRGERSLATGGVAILGGVLFGAALMIILATTPTLGPDRAWGDPILGPILVLTTSGGLLAMSLATIGLVMRYLARLRPIGVAGGSVAFLAAFLGALGAFQLVLLLAAGSAALIWDLRSMRTLDRGLANSHLAAAVALVVVVSGALAGATVGALGILILPYPVTWIAIGNSLLRGPSPGEAAAHT